MEGKVKIFIIKVEEEVIKKFLAVRRHMDVKGLKIAFIPN